MRDEILELRTENMYLKKLLVSLINKNANSFNIVTKLSTQDEKLALYTSLFKGREDVFAHRWENSSSKSGYSPVCNFEWQKPICKKPLIKCSECKHRQFVSLKENHFIQHMKGDKIIGLYPILKDHTCHFLVIDFDRGNWKNDVLLFVNICNEYSIYSNIERSRSGNGAHVWIFFSTNVPAKLARQLGQFLLNKTKEIHGDFELTSYDRMFPNQNFVSENGLGNLIALPLQKEAALNGNSLFVDEAFNTYPDQWLYLSSVKKISINEIETTLKQSTILKESTEENNTIEILQQNGIHVPKNQLSNDLVDKIERVATFSNPNYFKAKARRLPTHNIPKRINCSTHTKSHIIIPRGCMEELEVLLVNEKIPFNLIDKCNQGEDISVQFHGSLTVQQNEVMRELIQHKFGTLSATTGFGKTVLAASIIAKRKKNTLIIVHRTQLLKQWTEQLATFLNISSDDIGKFGGGLNTINGRIDIATIQSLNYRGNLKSFITNYGQVIVDECHIISAITFERVMKQIRPSYVLGLTATPKRKDGYDPIIQMQCGAIRSVINAKNQSKVRPFKHVLIERYTGFTTEENNMNTIYSQIGYDRLRNNEIFDDVLNALEEGRSPIILTERIEHLKLLEEMFSGFVKNMIVLSGESKAKDRKLAMDKIKGVLDEEERLIIATGKYIGEGFDDARLDTLFLTMPIAWKGTLQQYVGRLHRLYKTKKEVRVYDYIDKKVPKLKGMYKKRLVGYKSMGYVIEGDHKTEQMKLF